MESILGYMEKYDFENLLLCQDRAIGFRAVIAIHDTTLGPATGGCRMWQYDSEMDAVEDALRLARGMTYKYAAAGVNLGGGKTVIIGDPYRKDREPIFRTLGKFINRLGGKYITGEDVGTTLTDMEYIRMETPYVVTLPTYLGGAGRHCSDDCLRYPPGHAGLRKGNLWNRRSGGKDRIGSGAGGRGISCGQTAL